MSFKSCLLKYVLIKLSIKTFYENIYSDNTHWLQLLKAVSTPMAVSIWRIIKVLHLDTTHETVLSVAVSKIAPLLLRAISTPCRIKY